MFQQFRCKKGVQIVDYLPCFFQPCRYNYKKVRYKCTVDAVLLSIVYVMTLQLFIYIAN